MSCATPDCARQRITLELASRAALMVDLSVRRQGLPASAAGFFAARGAMTTPSLYGDMTVRSRMLQIPGTD